MSPIDSPHLTSELNLSDAQSLRERASYCLTEWSVVSLSGRDVTDLTQRLLTLDTRSLAEGSGSRCFLLDARGRVKHHFWLLRERADQLYAICEGGRARAEELIDAIDMFIFSEDVRLTLEPLSCLYLWGGGARDTLDQLTQLKRFAMSGHGVSDERLTLISPDQLESTLSALTDGGYQAVSTSQLEALRVCWGAPSTHEYREGVSPLDVSRDGISEGKGCYPGQEVIERTIAIGRPARYTTSISLRGEPDALQSITDALSDREEVSLVERPSAEAESAPQEPKRLGVVTSAITWGQEGLALAQLKQSARDAQLALMLSADDQLLDVEVTQITSTESEQ